MCCEKDLSYEEAKQLCRIAFDAGADYGSTSMQFNCNAVAYDWEHWLKENERLFMPKPTVEDVLREFTDEMNQNLDMYTGEVIDADEWRDADNKTVAEFAAKLQLREDK